MEELDLEMSLTWMRDKRRARTNRQKDCRQEQAVGDGDGCPRRHTVQYAGGDSGGWVIGDREGGGAGCK